MWTTAPWFALHGAGWRDPAADQPSAQALTFQIEAVVWDRNPSPPRWSVGRCALRWPAGPARHRAHFLLTPLSVAGALWVRSAPLLLQDPGFPVIVAEGTGAPGGPHRAVMTPGHFPTYWLEANPKEARNAIPRVPRRRRRRTGDCTDEPAARSLGAGQGAEGCPRSSPSIPSILQREQPRGPS